MDLRKSPAVKRWFTEKEKGKPPKPRYKQSTENGYINHMKMFCHFLGRTPDEIIESIKTAEDPIREMDLIYRTLLSRLIRMGLKVRSVDQRTNCFNSFLRYNGIQLTRELKKHIKFLRKGLFRSIGVVLMRKAPEDLIWDGRKDDE